MTSRLFVLVILVGSVEVNNVLYVLNGRQSLRVPSLEQDKNAELAYMEKVDQTLSLVFWQLRRQHKALQLEPLKEYLQSVGLDLISHVDQQFSIEDAQFYKNEKEHEFVKRCLGQHVEVV